jgi:hypothetical protein
MDNSRKRLAHQKNDDFLARQLRQTAASDIYLNRQSDEGELEEKT